MAALALHGLVAIALLALAASHGATIEDAAITIFVDPSGQPVATATEAAAQPAAEAQAATPPPAPELSEAIPPPEPMEAVTPDFSQPPPQHELRDIVPPSEPAEALAPPDFKPPPPPPPKVEPRKPPAPTPPQKVEPRPAPPAAARAATPAPSPARSPLPGAVPGNAAPSAPSAAAPSAAPSVAPGWNALLAAWLAAHRRYPEEARRRSEEGDVTVRFTVASDGRVSDVSLVKGSGWGALDTSALAMLKGATLPAPGVETTRTVRIRFRLSD